jgi:hypothetical protein
LAGGHLGASVFSGDAVLEVVDLKGGRRIEAYLKDGLRPRLESYREDQGLTKGSEKHNVNHEISPKRGWSDHSPRVTKGPVPAFYREWK